MHLAQIFSLLLALGGFGVDANPKAPTPDQVFEHAVDDADLIVHVDVAAVVPRNFKALTDLPTNPSVKGNPDLVAATKDLANQANQARAMVKSMAGFDFVTDVSSITLFGKMNTKGDMDGVVEIRGNIPSDLVAKVSKMTGSPMETFGGRSGVALPDHHYLGVAKSGSVLVGTDTLVKARLADTWKAPARAAGSKAARLAALIDEKPFFVMAFTPSATMVKMIEGKAGKSAATAFLADLDLVAVTLRSDGMVWATYAKSAKGFDRAALAADGMIDLMRALQIAPRGYAKLVMAYIDLAAGKDKDIDELIKHKDDVLKIVDQFTGDGQFKAQIDKDAKAHSVVVHALGKKLSDVVPFGLAIPAGAVAYLVFAGGRSSSTMQMPPPPPPPVHRTAPPAHAP